MDMQVEPAAAARYAELFIEGLHEAGVSLVAALPDSKLASIYRLCAADPAIRYVPVTNEAELPGIVAGAYLGGKRALMVMENSGLRQGCEAIVRFAYCHHMPMVMVMSYRGDLGESNWWGHNHAQVMKPLLEALRIPHFPVARLDAVKPAIAKALTHADASQWPVALIFSGECVDDHKPAAH
jgi:sulfopyruvate decarboxylase subunit alpha